MEKNITVLFVSYYSDHIIEKSIMTIDKNIKIIVVENSKNFNFKFNLEKKYPNVKVIIPDENLGNGAGINHGVKHIKTKYTFYLDVDTELFPKTIESLISAAKEIKEFSILAPKINNFEYKKDCFMDYKNKTKNPSMKFVTGCALFFETKLLDDIGYFDENIFLYFEENDFYQRCLNKNKNIFLIENSKINHKGNSAVKEEYKEEIEINRNWHLMWSTFYYHKKHFGKINAYIKILPKFFSALIKFSIFFLTNNKKKKDKYYARFNGSLNSIIGKKSWYRPKHPK